MNYEYINRATEKSGYDRGHVVKESEVAITPTDQERYLSMFGYDNSIYEHLTIAKTKNGDPTVSGFKGFFFCRYVYFDIDSEDLQESHEMAKNFMLLLYNILNISPKSAFISFSGNKGFHIGLPQILFGNFEPRKDMPHRIEMLVRKLLCECFEVTMEEMVATTKYNNGKKVFNLMDLSIYNDNRIFRVINSRNFKSGLYKIGLTYDELNSLTIDQIKELARSPRPYKPEIPATHLRPIPELQALWASALVFDAVAFERGFKRETTAGGNSTGSSIFFVPDEGGRNNAFFKQAAHLADYSQLTEGQIFSILKSINQACKKPLDDQELRKTVNSAFHSVKSKKASDSQEPKPPPVKEVEVYQDWVTEWAEYYSQEPKPFTYLFSQIDQDQEQNFSRKLACFIGQGGTRKSYLALNIAAENILNNKARVIYSSMEMGKVEMVNRLLDMTFSPDKGVPASKICRQNLKAHGMEYLEMLKKAIVEYDDRLILSNVSDKTATDYMKDYQKTVELYGPVDFLIVDGLSMMGGSGSETERFEKHTKELKGLANATGLNIILICHTTKEAKQWTRDCTSLARGSGKIFDNCDFTISFSNLIDDKSSTPESIEFVQGLGHIKYYNKRGTGLMFNSVYEFSGVTKKVSVSHQDPRHFPEYESFVRQYNAKQRQKDKNKTESQEWSFGQNNI